MSHITSMQKIMQDRFFTLNTNNYTNEERTIKVNLFVLEIIYLTKREVHKMLYQLKFKETEKKTTSYKSILTPYQRGHNLFAKTKKKKTLSFYKALIQVKYIRGVHKFI